MTRMKAALAIGFLTVSTSPVLAMGEVMLIGPQNTQLQITCDVATCDVYERRLDGPWRHVETLECGQHNFNLLEFKYRAVGYRA